MSRLNDYPYPQAFKPGKTVIMSPVTPFRLREGELELGRPFPEREGRPSPVNPHSMGAWDLPPASMSVGSDPVSQWSALPLADETHEVAYLEGWAMACLSVWSLDSKAIRRRAGDLHAIGFGAEIGLAQLTLDCARYAPRKVARHFVAVHLATATVVGDGPAVDALLIELRNRNNPSAEWVPRVAQLWMAVDRVHAEAVLAELVRSGGGLRVAPAPGALETFEPDVGNPWRGKTTLDMVDEGDLAVSSADGSERGFAQVSSVVTQLGWAGASVDRTLSLSWEPADTKKMDPDLALLAQLKAALVAHCALEALVWATLRLRGGTDSTLTRWVEVAVVDADGEGVHTTRGPVQTTIMGALAGLRAEGVTVGAVRIGEGSAFDRVEVDVTLAPEEPTPPDRKLMGVLADLKADGVTMSVVGTPKSPVVRRIAEAIRMSEAGGDASSADTVTALGGPLKIQTAEELHNERAATVGEEFRQHIQGQLDNGATLTEVAGPLLESEPTPPARRTKRRPKVDATPAPG